LGKNLPRYRKLGVKTSDKNKDVIKVSRRINPKAKIDETEIAIE